MGENKEKLVEELRRIGEVFGADLERAHSLADNALLDYIDDEEVRLAYGDIWRWYA